MRISDWSSDVCSSDLRDLVRALQVVEHAGRPGLIEGQAERGGGGGHIGLGIEWGPAHVTSSMIVLSLSPGKWQATEWPGPTPCSSGMVCSQASVPFGQRPYKRQTLGEGSIGLRGSPAMRRRGAA